MAQSSKIDSVTAIEIKKLWGLPQIAKAVDCIAPMIVELADLRDNATPS